MTESRSRRDQWYFSDPAVVARYARQDGLTSPEEAFLRSVPVLRRHPPAQELLARPWVYLHEDTALLGANRRSDGRTVPVLDRLP